jgi:DNA adenine methylase
MTQKHFSPLRYPGGKGKLLPFVQDLIIQNGLDGGSYSEPYAGGASVALGLLIRDYVSEIHINDIDNGIYCFWSSILKQTDDFLRKIWDTPLSVEEWRRQIYVRKNQSEFNSLEIGFSTFYLNRTNRSGVINAGVIGGLDQTGPYKIDARFNKDGLAKRINTIASHRNQIKVYHQDAIKFITKTLPKKKGRGLIFLDPPYYAKGKKLYTSFYEHEDHEKVADAIKGSPHKHWIVTYDNADQINEIYDLKNKVTYNLRYSLNHQSTGGSELLFHSENIVLPYHPNENPRP